VHCFGGRSRSAALIAAYIMSSRQISFDETLKIIRAVRPIVSINKGFETQLRAYFEANFNVYVAQQILLRKRVKILRSRRIETNVGGAEPMVLASARSVSPVASSGHKRSWDVSTIVESMDCEVEEDDCQLSADCKSVSRDQHDSTDTKVVEDSLQNINKRSKNKSSTPLVLSPRCLLTSPGSSFFRVLPSLQGLGQAFGCAGCKTLLFHSANIIRPGLQLPISRSGSSDNIGTGGEHTMSVAEEEENFVQGDYDIDAAETAELQSLTVPIVSLPSVPKTCRRPVQFDFGSNTTGTTSSVAVLPSISKSFPSGLETPLVALPTITPRHRNSKSFFGDLPTASMTAESPATSIATSTISPVLPSSATVGSKSPSQPLLPGGVSDGSQSRVHFNVSTTSSDSEDQPAASPVILPAVKPISNSGRGDFAFNNSGSGRIPPDYLIVLNKTNLLSDKTGLSEQSAAKVLQMALDDETAVAQCSIDGEDVFYVEYLECFGGNVFKTGTDSGSVCCHNCGATLGGWSWLQHDKYVTDLMVICIAQCLMGFVS
jgi:hypothetical protein